MIRLATKGAAYQKCKKVSGKGPPLRRASKYAENHSFGLGR